MNTGKVFSFNRTSVFVGFLAAISFSTLANAQSISGSDLNANMAMNWAPLVIGVGALAFAIVTIFWLLRVRQNNKTNQITGQSQVAHLRAELDEYEAMLSCLPEVTLLWRQQKNPQMFGTPEIFGKQSMGLGELLNYESWLAPTDAIKLATGIKHLHMNGSEFSISLTTLSGQTIRAVGRTMGDAAIVRLRNATAHAPHEHSPQLANSVVQASPNFSASATRLVANLVDPAWLRAADGQLVFANEAYKSLCAKLNIKENNAKIPEIFSPQQLQKFTSSTADNTDVVSISDPLPGQLQNTNLVLSSIEGGSFGYLTAANNNSAALNASAEITESYLRQVMNALNDPVVVFDKKGQLSDFNAAYVSLFAFDKKWLSIGLNEREIIDQLRRSDLLPAVPDYRKWRTDHLKSYSLSKPRQDIWNLSDGRTLEVTATPNSAKGGVIYTFSDVSEQLRLQSHNNTMLNVQRETLNSLSEGVAVFGTDGRLRLHNPQLSTIWKLPMNELGQNPHIDQIALACGKAISADGEEIWQRLKPSVIDLNPSRKDKTGRIQTKDGRLINYTIVRLGDAQTMLTFMDVTQSANYENVLKERNDALVTADRLKDAFVQNVSYELRSPLTSIIGFADLLASDSSGTLSEQQRAYTDYIRSSSATLGVLIDSILDLTNVDAGIAELDLKEQDIASLIERAKTGLTATLVNSEGAAPLNLHISLPETMPRFVADGARVVQILYNLLSNAAKFSEPGAQINLSVEDNEDWVRFTIQDEGVGISDALKDELTKSDSRQSFKGLQRGAGIGLLIVKAFVELHRGNISTEPCGHGGSKIIVNLPADGAKLIKQAQTG